MSFFVIPTEASFEQRPSTSCFGRCGSSVRVNSSPFDLLNHNNRAIPNPFLNALLANEEDEDQDYIQLSPWQRHVEQLRRQEYLQEVQRRQRYLEARRQQQQLLEQERERQRERAQRERLARLAWHREQQQRAAAQEYQRRLEAYQKRQQHEYAERARLAAKRYEHDWEQVATEAMFGMINLAQQLFGGEEEQKNENVASSSTAEEKKEKEEDVQPAKPVEQTSEDEAMQLDQGVEAADPVEAQPLASQDEANVEGQTQTKTQTSTDRLLFTYPLPTDESIRSSIRAENIQVSFDEPSRTIQLNGLWNNNNTGSDAGSSSTVQSDRGDSDGESRGRKRSRSPKKSRVSDVDEKTGEEITKQEDEEYVEVAKVQAKSPISKSIRLPEDVSVQGLRAEITDDGFQVWVH